VSTDLGIDSQKNPKFMMVTGIDALRRSGGSTVNPSSAVCYVAEVTSGKLAAYAIPWSGPRYAANQVQNGALVLVAATQFRQAVPGTGAAPGSAKGREKE
jgi:hypothetical protein